MSRAGCYLCDPDRPTADRNDDWAEACPSCDDEFWRNPIGVIVDPDDPPTAA